MFSIDLHGRITLRSEAGSGFGVGDSISCLRLLHLEVMRHDDSLALPYNIFSLRPRGTFSGFFLVTLFCWF